MQRYFVNRNQVEQNRIVIRGDDVHHIKNVMRQGEGHRLICCDGKGTDYHVRIEGMDDRQVQCVIEEQLPSAGEPASRITVAQALPKGDKLEWVFQKGTELGAVSFQPFVSARTIVKLEGKKALKRQERWQRIVKEAAEQAHRGRIPEIELPVSWNSLLQTFDKYDRVLFAYEKEGNSLLSSLDHLDGKTTILVVVGPEGGFTKQEAEEAIAAGATPLNLGPRILRAETAPLALLSCILFYFGEMGGEPL